MLCIIVLSHKRKKKNGQPGSTEPFSVVLHNIGTIFKNAVLGENISFK